MSYCLQDLPPILRCFAGCAGWLYGNPADAHVVELDSERHRIVLSRYADFETSLAPDLVERTTVNRQRPTVRVFSPPPDAPSPILISKARFMSRDDPRLAEQGAFDAAVRAAGINALPRRHVTASTIRKMGLM